MASVDRPNRRVKMTGMPRPRSMQDATPPAQLDPIGGRAAAPVVAECYANLEWRVVDAPFRH